VTLARLKYMTKTGPLRFSLAFIALYALLMGAFEASRGSRFERFVVEDAVLRPTVWLINAVTPSQPVELIGRTIGGEGTRLHVTRGCEGIEMLLMLIAAIIAFPTAIERRIGGLLIGAALAYGLSVARLVALDWTLRYSPQAWDALHGLILPIGPIVLLALYFLRWSSVAAQAPRRLPHAA
jgi:exosortase/archaeosortase family protein